MPHEGRYERDDVLVRTARWWGGYLFLFTVASTIFAVIAFALIVPSAFSEKPQTARGRQIPSGPLLQDNETARTDIAALRRREDAVLSTAGPSLYHAGARRVPIAQAMDELARRGLPTPKGTPPPPPEPLPNLPGIGGGHD